MNVNTQLNGSGRGRLFMVAVAILATTALVTVASAGAVAKKGGGVETRRFTRSS